MKRLLKHPFIVLEGVDGTGKSTVSKLVADSVGGIRIATPMGHYASSRPKFTESTWVPLESFKFYLDSVISASEKISDLCKENIVVCDRFIASTFAYHTGMGLEPEVAKSMIANAKILWPTIGFLLDATDEVLYQRLSERQSKPLRKGWLEKIRAAYLSFNYKQIDTTHLNPEEVSLEVVAHLKKNEIIQG
jgi:dTMP kinase